MSLFKNLYNKYLGAPDSTDMARRELELSRKAFLEAKTHTEYYTSQVDFETKRIKRLEEYLDSIDGKKKTR
jgi:maltooligosyltrehalose synthase